MKLIYHANSQLNVQRVIRSESKHLIIESQHFAGVELDCKGELVMSYGTYHSRIELLPMT